MNKTIIFVLTLISFFSVAVFVNAAKLYEPVIAPDSPFYFLKSWKESIQTFFTFGLENKAKQYLRLAEVRLAEYQKMFEKGKTEIAEKTLTKYQNQLNRALEKAEELENKGKDIEELKNQIKQTTQKHLEVLQQNIEKVPEQAKKGIENAIENSEKQVENVLEKELEILKDETADWKTYRNEKYGFEIVFPESWEGHEIKIGTTKPPGMETRYGFYISVKDENFMSAYGNNVGVYGIFIYPKKEWSEDMCKDAEGPCYQGKFLGENSNYVFQESNVFLQEDPCDYLDKDSKFCEIYRDMYKDEYGKKSFKIL